MENHVVLELIDSLRVSVEQMSDGQTAKFVEGFGDMIENAEDVADQIVNAPEPPDLRSV